MARTGAQIAQYSDRVLPAPDTAGLVGYWRLDETDAEFALDYSPAAHATELASGGAMPGRAYGPNLPGYPLAVPEPGAAARAVAVALGLALAALARRRSAT